MPVYYRALALRSSTTLRPTSRSAAWNTSRCGGPLHTSFVVPASTLQFGSYAKYKEKRSARYKNLECSTYRPT